MVTIVVRDYEEAIDFSIDMPGFRLVADTPLDLADLNVDAARV